ncbi:recombinational DNA repair ATPase [Pelotomaculum thermopropionicum SI]|uniref:DNA replication and repair protein RecF n=1 Tax=Pelotomaculum thermopropionicum (strain DSM 13744 / JCM 10971 / SI) TaxID=370438 RepID=RECF_PELTS|nr:RecName: Full=DNA replication and repair protein RecF [Pelotomaculum thermopropionicum SI]BAF58184.1 recombinational DNA repair ATPase [Pelotomaculum thermopropionicum SI]
MLLRRLEMLNFRNFARQAVEPGLYFNVLSGRNAQGKTNILESIYLACTGRSFRTAREKELIKREKEFSSIRCLFETRGREVEVKVTLVPGRKRIEVNGVLKSGHPFGWPGVVLFTPDDLVMIKGSPAERRRFLDYDLGPFHPHYAHCLDRYNRVLSQRNALLREAKEKRTTGGPLEVWDEQLCRYGSRLLFLRVSLLKKFFPAIRALHRELTEGAENIEISYLSSLKIGEECGEDEIYERFSGELRLVRDEEIARMQTLVGPHRDDLHIKVDGHDARVYCSQGQQRTIVLTLKVFLIEQWRSETGEYPILLLDDVLFELDDNRREALMCRLGGLVQTFLTCTRVNFDIEGFKAKVFTVSGGEVT